MPYSDSYGPLVKVLAGLRAHDERAVEMLAIPQNDSPSVDAESSWLGEEPEDDEADDGRVLLRFSTLRDPAVFARFVQYNVISPEHANWDAGRRAASAFRDREGHLVVPYNHVEGATDTATDAWRGGGFPLGRWLSDQQRAVRARPQPDRAADHPHRRGRHRVGQRPHPPHGPARRPCQDRRPRPRDRMGHGPRPRRTTRTGRQMHHRPHRSGRLTPHPGRVGRAAQTPYRRGAGPDPSVRRPAEPAVTSWCPAPTEASAAMRSTGSSLQAGPAAAGTSGTSCGTEPSRRREVLMAGSLHHRQPPRRAAPAAVPPHRARLPGLFAVHRASARW